MNLYAQPTPWLQRAHDAGLVTLHTQDAPSYSASIARGLPCACHVSLVVNGRTMIVRMEEQSISAHPGYVLPNDCTPEEQLTVVTWLARNRLVRFCTEFQSGKLTRCLDKNLFRKKLHECQNCFVNTLEHEPVFCMKQMVVSAQNKGPTLESVLSPNATPDQV